MITRMELFSAQVSAPELALGGFMPSDDPVQVRNIEGLGPVKADITSTALASGRGEQHQGTFTGKRNIVMTLGLNPDWENETMATLRQRLYTYLMPEQWTKLRFFSSHLPTCDIEGIVESFEPNMFSEDPEIQVSVICHKPDFVDVDATIFNGVVDDGTEELSFEYIGSVPTGFEVRIDGSTDLPAYTGDITVVNKTPIEPQMFQVIDVTINALKFFKLTSIRNQKRVANLSTAGGVVTNLMAKMTDESVWPEIRMGENNFSVAAETPGQVWTLAYFNRFGGL